MCAAAGAAAGGLFELVSCPHYLAEIVIYLGLLIASGGQLMPLLMLVWVVSCPEPTAHTCILLLVPVARHALHAQARANAV